MKKTKFVRWLALLLTAMVLLSGCTPLEAPVQQPTAEVTQTAISENGTYSSKDEVAEYLHEFGHLPPNYLTKKEAQDLGWVASKGNLWEVAPGKSIGGDRFGNREGLLPEAPGRKYYECDIDFDGSYRNAKRIIYSNDGLIFYTEDHYESFQQLYGEVSPRLFWMPPI